MSSVSKEKSRLQSSVCASWRLQFGGDYKKIWFPSFSEVLRWWKQEYLPLAFSPDLAKCLRKFLKRKANHFQRCQPPFPSRSILKYYPHFRPQTLSTAFKCVFYTWKLGCVTHFLTYDLTRLRQASLLKWHTADPFSNGKYAWLMYCYQAFYHYNPKSQDLR